MTLFEQLAAAAKAGAKDEPGVVSQFRWATVEGVGPVRVRLDRDPEPLPLTPFVLVDQLRVGDRVRVEIRGRNVIIIGKTPTPGTSQIIQVGESLVQAPAGGGLGTKQIVFAEPFPSKPTITVTGDSSVAAFQSVRAASPTATGFTIVMERSNDTPTTCMWQAIWSPLIQVTP